MYGDDGWRGQIERENETGTRRGRNQEGRQL